MASILVHNISDRPETDATAHSVTIGEIKIKPGKFAEVPEESINTKHKALHGISLWFGKLPVKLYRKDVAASKKAMTKEEVHAYLNSKTYQELLHLNNHITPSFVMKDNAPKRRLVYNINEACFSRKHVLDPATFSWLGRWTKLPNGDYKEV